MLREAISHELTIYANNLPQYCSMYEDIINPLDSPLKYKARVNNYNDTLHFKKEHEDLYKINIKNQKIMKQPKEGKVIINHHFVDGGFIEVNGKSTSTFKVEFFDENGLFYQDTIQSNS